MKVLGCLLMLVGLLHADEEQAGKVYPGHVMCSGMALYRATMADAFPEMKLVCHLYNGPVMLEVYEDKNAPAIMVSTINAVGTGRASCKRNGKLLPRPPGEEVKLLLDHAGGRPTPFTVGYRIPLKRTDTFEMKGELDTSARRMTAKVNFLVTYDPDRGWLGSISMPEFDEKEFVAGDAHEISLESLVKRVVEVLEVKEKCVFKFKDGDSTVLRRWDADVPEQLELQVRPMLLTLGKSLEINQGPAMEKLTIPALDQRLQMYEAALRGEYAAVVRIRVKDGASDELFRETLRSLRKARVFDHAYVERVGPKRKP